MTPAALPPSRLAATSVGIVSLAVTTTTARDPRPNSRRRRTSRAERITASPPKSRRTRVIASFIVLARYVFERIRPSPPSLRMWSPPRALPRPPCRESQGAYRAEFRAGSRRQAWASRPESGLSKRLALRAWSESRADSHFQSGCRRPRRQLERSRGRSLRRAARRAGSRSGSSPLAEVIESRAQARTHGRRYPRYVSVICRARL